MQKEIEMTVARAKLVNPEVTRWYHCISRCVRNAFLIDGDSDEPDTDRKEWIDKRLLFLNKIFAVSMAGYSILDNHLHMLIRIDSEDATRWTPQEVARRWFTLFPPRGSNRQIVQVTDALLDEAAKDLAWIAKIRDRLCSISWFMKCLKEPLARMANKVDKCRGAFFEGRFKSIGILDEQSLLTVCTYIDLNPVAAGISKTPENSLHTSIKTRIDHVKRQLRLDDLKVAIHGNAAASRVAAQLEDELWLIPIEDRRLIDSQREGMLTGFTLGNYVLLVEHTGRLVRDGKASISSDLADIFTRLGTTEQNWHEKIKKMTKPRPTGSFMASNRQTMQQTARKLGYHHLVNAYN